MVAVKASAVDAFIARPPGGVFCFLVYGPDGGLVSEHSAALIAAAVEDPADPFATTRLDGDDIAGDPARLLDEAYAIALFGGSRAIHVRLGGRQIQSAVEKLLGGPKPEARIVIQAGDLRKGAPLRNLCERHPAAAAIPCYADTEAGLARLVDAELASVGVTIEREARALLLASLGGDRLASRQEIAKLLLHVHGAASITPADVDAVIADTASRALDDIVDAAFIGDMAGLERGLAISQSAGDSTSSVLAAALRHALQLQRVAILTTGGASASVAVERGWPGLHFRRRPLVERMASRWRLDALSRAIDVLGDAVLMSRRTAVMADALAGRALVSIAGIARQSAR